MHRDELREFVHEAPKLVSLCGNDEKDEEEAREGVDKAEEVAEGQGNVDKVDETKEVEKRVDNVEEVAEGQGSKDKLDTADKVGEKQKRARAYVYTLIWTCSTKPHAHTHARTHARTQT